jgi:cell division protein FtsI (penicillin-binding protein 3)
MRTAQTQVLSRRLTTPTDPGIIMTVGRARIVLIGLGLLFFALIARALYLQVVQQHFLLGQADARFRRTLTLEANRGLIVDRNGEPLAISTPVQSIWASPSGMEAVSQDKLNELARLLELPVSEIAAKLADKERDFVYIKRQISPELAAKVMALGIPGIAKQQEYRRYYPAGEMLAQVIGFTGVDGKGQEGLELQREKMLAGKNGSRVVLKDRRGNIIEDVAAIDPPKDGQTLTLSIDHRIQYLAYREISKQVEAAGAKAGSVIVLDGKTGEILAMANVPTYNPNNREKLDPEMRRNRAVVNMIEPGSTMKPIVTAMALNAGKVTPNTVFDTHPYRIGPATVKDDEFYPSLTLTGVLQKSSNVGASKMAFMFTPEQMWSFYNEVGLGRLPKTGFPGEVAGRLRPWKNWRPIEQATMSFGYGVSVSLLQMARAYTMFTNNGEELPLSFTKLNTPLPGVQIIKPENAHAIGQMLIAVTQEGGTAVRARVLGYNVAGKSGTARKLVNGSYAANQHVGLFIGFAPVSNPRLIVAVMVDDPTKGSYFGGTVSGPVFSAVLGGSLRILGIPPDAPANNTLVPANPAAEVRETT